MDNELSHDTKRMWFLWGMILAWIPVIPAIIGIFNAFRGISEQKATGLGAVAGGVAEVYATLGMILVLILPVVAIVLLGKSRTSVHPKPAFISWRSWTYNDSKRCWRFGSKNCARVSSITCNPHEQRFLVAPLLALTRLVGRSMISAFLTTREAKHF